MSKKRDSAEKRLKETIAVRTDPEYLIRKRNAIGLGKAAFRDFTPEEIFCGSARANLRLRQDDHALRKAFEIFKLDSTEPRDWAELARILASIVFVARKRGGAKEKWTPQRLAELIDAVELVKRKNPNITSDRGACRLLARRNKGPSYFHDAGFHGLRKQLTFARAQQAERAAGKPPTAKKRKSRRLK